MPGNQKGRIIMLKKFIDCKTKQERVSFFHNSHFADWTESELETVAEIAGIKLEAGLDVAQKFGAIDFGLTKKMEENK